MIENDQQYELTKKWAERFEEAARAEGLPHGIHAAIATAYRAACEEKATGLREKMAEYERRKAQP